MTLASDEDRIAILVRHNNLLTRELDRRNTQNERLAYELAQAREEIARIRTPFIAPEPEPDLSPEVAAMFRELIATLDGLMAGSFPKET